MATRLVPAAAPGARPDLLTAPLCWTPPAVPEALPLLTRLEGIADAHNGYSQLFDIAELVQERCADVRGLFSAPGVPWELHRV